MIRYTEHPKFKRDRNCEIYRAYKNGETKASLARKHGVTPVRITQLVTYYKRVAFYESLHARAVQ